MLHKLLMSPALLDITLGLVWLEAIAGLIVAIVIVGVAIRQFVSAFRADNAQRNRQQKQMTRVLEFSNFRRDAYRVGKRL